MTRKYTVFITVFVLLLISFSGISTAQKQDSSEKISEIDDEKVNIVLQSDKESAELGEPIIVQMSATNYIDTQSPIKIQLILESTQGVSISGGTTQQGADNQFSTVTTLQPGESDSVRVEVRPDQPGEYNISGEIIYFPEGNEDESLRKRVNTNIIQNQPTSIWDYTGTILGFAFAFVITGYLFRSSGSDTIDSIRYEPDYRHEDFSSAMKYVIIASFCIGLSGTWFSFTNVDFSGFTLFTFFAGLTLIVGLILAYIGKLRFNPQLRVACAYISCVTILAMPIQLFFTTIIFGF